ncbi:MAG: hypothetical protein LBM67_01475 [Lentimicrobiaceae bacterium]|jgi:hypothetical protein|nr:hypothetical protein [Lentimicrobiaceae bacterium]
MIKILNFLENKVLEELWSKLEDGNQAIDYIIEKVDAVNDKLDTIRYLPFSSAMTFLREGDIPNFRLKIIDAKNIDVFNLAAQLAY